MEGAIIEPVRVFISYSHRDDDLREKVIVHLATLKRQGLIKPWFDREVTAGREFDEEIRAKLDAAEIILLLISPDFLASDYCTGTEMRVALERHGRQLSRVVPVILRTCDWKDGSLDKLLALPRDGKPVTKWTDADEALYDVAAGLRRIIWEIRGIFPDPHLGPPDSPVGQSILNGIRSIRRSGDLTALSCDRDIQAQQFTTTYTNAITARPGAPHVVFVPGARGQGHEGLTARIRSEWLPAIGRRFVPGFDRQPELVRLPWPSAFDRDSQINVIAQRLYDEYDIAIAPSQRPTAEPLKQSKFLTQCPFVVVAHTIESSEWQKCLPALQYYVEHFWPPAESLGSPRFVIVINIAYRPRFDGGTFWRLLNGESRSVWRALADVSRRTSIPVTILHELRPVSSLDVRNWFQMLNADEFPWTEFTREQAISRMFNRKFYKLRTLPMAEIEAHLQDVLRDLYKAMQKQERAVAA